MPLVFVVGPPAVGKMTVGHALAGRTGLRLFHNHVTSDVVTRCFDYGTPAYGHLVTEFRTRIFEEVAASDLPGLIFTYVWAFGDPGDAAFVVRLAGTFSARGRPVYLVELEAPLPVRLERNASEFRLAEKPTKRDLDASRRHLLDVEARYRLNSAGEFATRPGWLDGYLRLDNAALSPDAARADRRSVRAPAFGRPAPG
ncbi:hypothetical protein tb265_11200 [Gemmatimonadetes bacterium T265]|nr:hypothetical protein tb265_11200 [Gemmatimonadetes bacterium T265]